MWARQLMRRIRNPMDVFERHPTCLKAKPEASKIIRNFNQLATVLVEFEILYHNGWLKQVEVAKTGVQLAFQSLFVNYSCNMTVFFFVDFQGCRPHCWFETQTLVSYT